MVNPVVLVTLLVVIVGGFLVACGLAWPWLRRRRRVVVGGGVLLLLVLVWVLAAFAMPAGRRVTVTNDAKVPYVVLFQQGSGPEVSLGTFAPGASRRLRIRPERGAVSVRFQAPDEGGAPSGSLGFSLDSPAFFPSAARISIGPGGEFGVSVGPAILVH